MIDSSTLRSAVLRLTCIAVIATLAGCSAGVRNGSGVPAEYVSTDRQVEGVSGLGVEAQDYRAMTDQMVRDLLASPLFAGNVPARVIIDDRRFLNESDQIMNMSLVVDRLRIELMRAAAGRIQFVSRENVDIVEEEKELKDAGVVSAGSTDFRQGVAGADYRLVGRIASQSTASNNSGLRSSTYLFTFELIDLNTGYVVWGNLYEQRKAGADDTIYR